MEAFLAEARLVDLVAGGRDSALDSVAVAVLRLRFRWSGWEPRRLLSPGEASTLVVSVDGEGTG